MKCSYKTAVRKHPGCPAEVRLGLAACYNRLGQLGQAKKAYERVLQLNPVCPEALYGMAVLRFSSSQGESAKTVCVCRTNSQMSIMCKQQARCVPAVPSVVFPCRATERGYRCYVRHTTVIPAIRQC